MAESVATPILRRGAQLIAYSDIVIGILGIIGGISGAIRFPYWTSSTIAILVVGIVVNFFMIVFGILLLLGARNGRVGFIWAWYLPNMILIGIVTIFGVVFAFFMVGYVGTLVGSAFGGVIVLRSVEIWIVYELCLDFEANQQKNEEY